ncbi:hypothetical protein VDGL01_04518 [Verticillium dahliae]
MKTNITKSFGIQQSHFETLHSRPVTQSPTTCAEIEDRIPQAQFPVLPAGSVDPKVAVMSNPWESRLHQSTSQGPQASAGTVANLSFLPFSFFRPSTKTPFSKAEQAWPAGWCKLAARGDHIDKGDIGAHQDDEHTVIHGTEQETRAASFYNKVTDLLAWLGKLCFPPETSLDESGPAPNLLMFPPAVCFPVSLVAHLLRPLSDLGGSAQREAPEVLRTHWRNTRAAQLGERAKPSQPGSCSVTQ